MSRNSSRIKASEKFKEGFCLATKIRVSFRDFQSFTGFFQKGRSLCRLDGFSFFLSILFVYMLHRRPPLHGRKQLHMRSKRSHRHLFEFSSSQLAYYLWTGVTSSFYRRTRHNEVASNFKWNVPIVRKVHVLSACLSKLVTLLKRSRRCPFSEFGSILPLILHIGKIGKSLRFGKNSIILR